MAKTRQFATGETVWHVLATEKDERGLVVGITEWLDGSVTYEVTWPDRDTTSHTAYELSKSFRPDWAQS